MRLLTVLLMILPLAALPDLAEAKSGRDKAKPAATTTTAPKPAPTATPAKPRKPPYSGADFDQTLGLGNYFNP
ncbi:MAG: hypothetical protein O9292_05815 [Rhodobacteraceae bacterium]|nr:hypothetical protein [Paracoccaceae bacterium]